MTSEIISAIQPKINDVINSIPETVNNMVTNKYEDLDIYTPNIVSGEPTTINNGWDENKENMIKRWMEENKVYAWVLKKEYMRYDYMDQMLTVPIIILLSASGITSLSSTSLDEDSLRALAFVAGIVQMLIGGLVAAKHVYNFGKKAQIFQHSSKKYTTMNNDFYELMTEKIEERPNGTVYIREKNKERNDLFESSPAVSEKTWAEFKKKLNNII